MVLFDAHVHLQNNVILENLLDGARGNFIGYDGGRGPGTFCLLLAEAGNLDIYAILKKKAGAGLLPGWHLQPTQEPESLRAVRDDWPGGRLFILAGRQIVTAEKIEVLALATPAKISDGLALDETVEAARRQQGLAVLPWGVGKWLGERGAILERFVNRAAPERLFLGDNGGRPIFWPAPRLFLSAASRGIRLLPGSDPLPLPEEDARVGSYGGGVEGEIGDDHPAADLRQLLSDRSRPIVPFGRRTGILRFVRTQVALRLPKRG